MRAGVDTWSPAWYVDPNGDTAKALRERATIESARRSMLIPDPVGGHRVGWFPDHQLVFAEGHPAGLKGDLASAETLPAAYARLQAVLEGEGLPMPRGVSRKPWKGAERIPGAAGLRRLDLALDVWVDDPDDGLALLEAVAMLVPPRHTVDVWWSRGRVQTVNWRGYGGRRMVARVYDKGVEADLAPPGQLIRLEDQRRYGSGTRPPVEAMTPATVHQLHSRRFAPLTAAATLTAGDAEVLRDHLADLVRSGELRAGKAQRLLGTILLDAEPSMAFRKPTSSTYRHRAELRELGLVLLTRMRDPAGQLDQGDKRVLQLGEVFRRVLGPELWDDLRAAAAAS